MTDPSESSDAGRCHRGSVLWTAVDGLRCGARVAPSRARRVLVVAHATGLVQGQCGDEDAHRDK